MKIDFDKIIEADGFTKISPLHYTKPHSDHKDIIITYFMRGFSQEPHGNYIYVKINLETVNVECKNLKEEKAGVYKMSRIAQDATSKINSIIGKAIK